MKMLESESKEILENYGIDTPKSGGSELVVKAQVQTNNRAEKGLVKFASGREEAERKADEIRGEKFPGRQVDDVLIEEKVDHDSDFYVSFIYDTDVRSPVMAFSREGGSGIEDREASKLKLEENQEFRFREFLQERGFEGKELVKLASTLSDLFEVFLEEDARLLEVNPLGSTEDGFLALDAMMETDDDASYRHSRNLPDRSDLGREKTKLERRAEKIDEDDHRGVAGKYTELEGDIGMMLAGGGASLTNMDALIEAGGKPANYTEYGGNPPTEKVYRLSKVVMDRELRGLWHVGGTANNTDIYRTMKGFVQALEEENPDYPIVIRRDGPNADRAFEMLREKRKELDIEMKLYRNDTPMTKTAESLMEMIEDE